MMQRMRHVPKIPVLEKYLSILESTALGHLATLDERGSPQVNPVWFLWDGEHILLSVKADTVKYRNLRRDPRMAISFADPANGFHYIELRGEVEAFELYRDLTFVNLLAQKYTGKDMDPREYGKERYKLKVRVDSWTGQ
jgi:PPOX class probable F420-dependent enzyme